MSLHRRFAVLALACIVPIIAFAASVGPTSTGTGADDAAIGTITWLTPENITASDDTRATCGGSVGGVTHYLKATNFGFAIPAGATINGIAFDLEVSKSGTSNGSDTTVKVVKSDGTIGTENKGTSTNLTTTDTYRTYGGAADLWSETWAYTDINDADFGVVLSITYGGAMITGRVDHVRCTITYTAAAATSTGLTTLGVGKPVSYKQTRSANRAQTAL